MPNKEESTTSVAEAIEFVGSALQHLDAVADHLNDISLYLKELANTSTLKAILEHGKQKDKKLALEFLKQSSGYKFD